MKRKLKCYFTKLLSTEHVREFQHQKVLGKAENNSKKRRDCETMDEIEERRSVKAFEIPIVAGIMIGVR